MRNRAFHRAFRPGRVALVLALAMAAASCEAPDLDKGLETGSLRQVLLRSAAGSVENHDYQSAAAAYRTLYARDPDDPEIALGFARNLRFIGALRQAIELLDRALDDDPDDGRLLAERGKIELARSRPVRALVFLDRAIEQAPDDWRTHSAIGIARDLMGRYERAARSYRAALKLSPGNLVVLNNLALSQALGRDIDLAIATLSEVVAQPQASAQSRQNLALLHAWNGDLAEAETLARRDLANDTVDNNLDYFRGLGVKPIERNPISKPSKISKPAEAGESVAPPAAVY